MESISDTSRTGRTRIGANGQRIQFFAAGTATPVPAEAPAMRIRCVAVVLRFEEGPEILLDCARPFATLPGGPLLRGFTPQDSAALALDLAGMPETAPDQVQLLPATDGRPEAVMVHLALPTISDLSGDAAVQWVSLSDAAHLLSEDDQEAVQVALEAIAAESEEA